MRRHLLVGVAVSLALLPATARADPHPLPRMGEVQTGQMAILDTHTAGMPNSSLTWQTFEYVYARTDLPSRTVTFAARLKAPMGVLDYATVSWALGDLTGEGCSESVTAQTMSSLEGGNGFMPSATLSVPNLRTDYSCLTARISPYGSGQTTDEIRGPLLPRMALSGAEAMIVAAPTRVVVGRSTPVLLVLKSHALASATVGLAASGAARLTPVWIQNLGADQLRPVVARLRADQAGRSSLLLMARSERGESDYDRRTTILAKAATARPRAGVYTSANTRISLRLTSSGRVEKLRVKGLACGPAATSWRGRIRLVRAGAAKVQETSTGWRGVSLLPAGPNRIRGSFVRTAGSCLHPLEFVLHRK